MQFSVALALALLQLVAAAPPTPDQLLKLQLSALSAQATASPSPSLGIPRPKQRRSNEPEFLLESRGHDQIMNQKRHGRMSRKRRLDTQERMAKRNISYRKRDAEEEHLEARDDLEQRAAEQYPFAANATSVQANAQPTNSIPLVNSAVTAAAPLQTPVASAPIQPSSFFSGVSSYYLFAMNDADRVAVLDAVKGAGFSVIRIFIASVGANNKGSNNAAVPDRMFLLASLQRSRLTYGDSVEPNQVGQYDDTILYKIDQLMAECKDRGLKLLIAMSDRYALGFWSTDSYAVEAGVVSAGSSGVQKVADASKYYTSTPMITSVDKRINHILNHQNAKLGNRRWAELDDVIYALEAQNEPMGHMNLASDNWVCERSQYIKASLPSGSSILVSSGGGITIQASLQNWATECPWIDIVSVHDYGTNPDAAVSALQSAANGNAKGKIVMMGEWGIAGANKAATIQSFVRKFKAAKIPHMYWQITKPGQGANDFEVWTDEPSWQALTGSDAYFPPTAVPSKSPSSGTGTSNGSSSSSSNGSSNNNNSSGNKSSASSSSSSKASTPTNNNSSNGNSNGGNSNGNSSPSSSSSAASPGRTKTPAASQNAAPTSKSSQASSASSSASSSNSNKGSSSSSSSSNNQNGSSGGN